MSQKTLDRWGHVAYVFLMAGTVCLASGFPTLGWSLRLTGSIAWAVLGWLMGYNSILFWSSVFTAVDAHGLWRS